MNIKRELHIAKRMAKWEAYALKRKVYCMAVPIRGTNGEPEAGDMLIHNGGEYILIPFNSADSETLVWVYESDMRMTFGTPRLIPFDESVTYEMKFHEVISEYDSDDYCVLIDWVIV